MSTPLDQAIAASELAPGHFVAAARGPAPPIVLASPHSGRAYPAAFVAAAALDLAGLRRAEDAWVDELAAPAAALGVPMIAARWARAFIDLNRAPDEIDTSLLSDLAGLGKARSTDRVRAGLGVLPRVAGPGLNIYAERFPAAAALSRIAAVHQPYHRRIAALLDEAVAANGGALLIDCHSMPPLPLAARQRPHFVIGDAGGSTAPEEVVRTIESYLRRAGYRTVRNIPYSGGYTTRFHADRPRGRHTVQLEIDRSLYMDVDTLERHPGFEKIAALLQGLVATLLEWLTPRAIAAE
jgi:N-formylglutamate amidohydrolase